MRDRHPRSVFKTYGLMTQPASLFISDLHLAPERPGSLRLFFRFLEEQAVKAESLYILGDLFDAWIGDDNQSPPIPEIIHAMRACSEHGTSVYLMHGNRDFLIGERFAQESGSVLLHDPTRLDMEGTPTLLMHGDLLCTDDREYQQARQLLRSPAFIRELMQKSIPERIALAAEYRKRSGEAISLKPSAIMDVNQQSVEQMMREQGVSRLIHGHTHRPACHDFELDGKPVQCLVLPEWHEERGGYLRSESGQLTLEAFT